MAERSQSGEWLVPGYVCVPGILAAGFKEHERRNPSFLGGQRLGVFQREITIFGKGSWLESELSTQGPYLQGFQLNPFPPVLSWDMGHPIGSLYSPAFSSAALGDGSLSHTGCWTQSVGAPASRTLKSSFRRARPGSGDGWARTQQRLKIVEHTVKEHADALYFKPGKRAAFFPPQRHLKVKSSPENWQSVSTATFCDCCYLQEKGKGLRVKGSRFGLVWTCKVSRPFV